MGNLFEDVEPLNVSSSTVRPGGPLPPVPVAVGDTVRCVQRGANVNITVGREYRVEQVGGGINAGGADDPNLRYHIENNAGVLRWYRAGCFERVAGVAVEQRAVHDEVVVPIDGHNLQQIDRNSLQEILERIRDQAERGLEY